MFDFQFIDCVRKSINFEQLLLGNEAGRVYLLIICDDNDIAQLFYSVQASRSGYLGPARQWHFFPGKGT
jgi:hypothetical protein